MTVDFYYLRWYYTSYPPEPARNPTKGGLMAKPSKNLSSAVHTDRKKAAQARKRRKASRSSGETYYEGLAADRREAEREARAARRLAFIGRCRNEGVKHLAGYGKAQVRRDGKLRARWSDAEISLAVECMDNFFSSEEEVVEPSATPSHILERVRVGFALTCIIQKMRGLPAQQADWYAGAVAEAELIRTRVRERRQAQAA